ncbi:helix-turn-helix transcriptional regulator [Bacillus sp. Gen3]|nr:helix-turn-helix transcriptional regulator [Bacillus sp. Gen3]
MISYEPFYKTLKRKNINISSMRDVILSSATLAKMNNGRPVNLETIEKICLHLDVPIEEVVKIIK